MTSKIEGFALGAIAVAICTALSFPLAPPAFARTSTVSATHQSVNSVVKVKSIDAATRHIVVTNPEGVDITMKVPDSVRRFSQIKVGDSIKATYTRETELIISNGNAPLPPDVDATVAARVKKGTLPAGSVSNHIVVTGAVLAIDTTNHTLRIVSPQGGEVHTVYVRQADRQQAMTKLKVGDKITAYVTESLAISLQPA
jgi:Cu/Ag efflux protein CusF